MVGWSSPPRRADISSNRLGGLTDDCRNDDLSCPRDVLSVFVPAIKQETTQTVMDDQDHALQDRSQPNQNPSYFLVARAAQAYRVELSR
jgi:hypothetical protein